MDEERPYNEILCNTSKYGTRDLRLLSPQNKVAHTPEHTIFKCGRFEEDRIQTATRIWQSITKENIAERLVRCKEDGKVIMQFLSTIMRKENAEERRRERENETGPEGPL